MNDPKKPDVLSRELLRLAQISSTFVQLDVEMKAASMLCGDVAAMIKTMKLFAHLVPVDKHAELQAGLVGRIQVARTEILPTMKRLYGQLGDLISKMEALNSDQSSPAEESKRSPE